MSPLPGGLSLADVLRRSGLEYDKLDGGLGVPFDGRRAERVGVGAWLEAPDEELVFLAAPLPEAPRRLEEAVLHNLLRVSFHAAFVKAVIWEEERRPTLVSVLPALLVTPRVAGAVVRGLACLADVDRRSASEPEGWQERLALYNLGVAASIDGDVERARTAVRAQAEQTGKTVLEGPQDSLVFGLDLAEHEHRVRAQLHRGIVLSELGLDLAEHELLVSARFAGHVTYFIVLLGAGVSGRGRKRRLNGLLELNRRAKVGKVGLNRKAELALLYEVPAPMPSVLADVQAQFGLLLRGLGELLAD
jgi:hypothetical protein